MNTAKLASTLLATIISDLVAEKARDSPWLSGCGRMAVC